jgi:hypothetical protein
MSARTLRGTGAIAPPSRHGVKPAAEISDGPPKSPCVRAARATARRSRVAMHQSRLCLSYRASEPPRSPALRRTPPALRRSAGATPSAPNLNRLLTPPPASASSPAALPGLALPHLNCIGGEKRGRGRERERKRRGEERSCGKRIKGMKRRKKETRKEKGKKKLFICKNMISKLYYVLLFGKENKK